jgi:hypothetical protein
MPLATATLSHPGLGMPFFLPKKAAASRRRSCQRIHARHGACRKRRARRSVLGRSRRPGRKISGADRGGDRDEQPRYFLLETPVFTLWTSYRRPAKPGVPRTPRTSTCDVGGETSRPAKTLGKFGCGVVCPKWKTVTGLDWAQKRGAGQFIRSLLRRGAPRDVVVVRVR